MAASTFNLPASRARPPRPGQVASHVQHVVCCLTLLLFAGQSARALPPNVPNGMSDEDMATALSMSFEKTISFPVCNGFANQRISLLFGVYLAAQTKRTAILPDIILDGTQYSDLTNFGNKKVPFQAFYDYTAFAANLAGVGVESLPASFFHTYVSESEVVDSNCMRNCKTAINEDHKDTPHIIMQCLFPSEAVAAEDVFNDRIWMSERLAGLQPAQKYRDIMHLMMNRLEFLAGKLEYNFLHLRIEDDWLSHCERWENIPDGVVRNNCLNNTFTIGEHLRTRGFETDRPLYVATAWPQVLEDHVRKIRGSLKDAGYTTISKMGLLPDRQLMREEGAMIEFYIGLQSERMIGNSVSSFSAMLILERSTRERWASYYNMGDIPLANFLPMYTLPWVFVWNNWSEEYEYMMKSAVRSAIRVGGIKPYCMLTGDLDKGSRAWLEAYNVTIVQHQPKWMLAMAERNDKSQQNLQHSHLYANPEYVIGTWQRIDIPIIPIFSEHNFMLYTDTDVFFKNHISLGDFGLPLPDHIGMGSEMQDMFPYNAGVLLINMDGMRNTHEAFLDFILSNQNGLYFDGYGPQDQGALNQYYEESVKKLKLPKKFNTKPYHDFDDDARLIHWHGPKPHDYLKYLEENTCRFGDMCRDGLSAAVCPYVSEWLPSALDSTIALRLHLGCEIFKAVSESQVAAVAP